MHPRSTRNGWSPSTATWNPSASPAREHSGRGTLTPPADREESHDEFPSWRTDARGDVVRPHYPGRYGGGRDRPTRTRGHAETGGPDAGPASASRRTASPAGLTPGPAKGLPT